MISLTVIIPFRFTLICTSLYVTSITYYQQAKHESPLTLTLVIFLLPNKFINMESLGIKAGNDSLNQPNARFPTGTTFLTFQLGTVFNEMTLETSTFLDCQNSVSKLFLPLNYRIYSRINRPGR
jgi:hypothetical protein